MKIDANVYQGKPPSLEQGPLKYEVIMTEGSNFDRVKRSNRCNRWIQFMKMVLYFELILFIAWIGCIFIQNYYQDHGYINPDKPYDVSYDPAINSVSIPAENIDWSSKENETKVIIHEKKINAESVIEARNNFIEAQTATTPSSNEIDYTDIDDQFFENLNNFWDKIFLKTNSKDFHEKSSRIINIFDEQNDVSSKEKISLIEVLDTTPTTLNEFDTIDKHNFEFSDIYLNDYFLEEPWEQDLTMTTGYPDDLMNLNYLDKDHLQVNDFTNFRFEFEFPSLMKRYESQVKMNTEEDKSLSISSSEEMNSFVPKEKRSAESSESSSSEETNNPAAKEKNSTETSTSLLNKETNNDLVPKVKRSADSSSSESDSSDSSSSEDEETTTKANKEKKNCPKIHDNDGSSIEDPKDIINHIKKNWFNWLLETPVPDCDGPNSPKTVTIDECGQFVIKCTSDESDETTENDKTDIMDHRNIRSAEENDGAREKCDRLVNRTREISKTLTAEVVTEESSDPMVINLRQTFEKSLMSLAIRVIAEQLIGEQDRTEEQWQNTLIEMRNHIIENLDVDQRQHFGETGVSVQEMTKKLRTCIESVVNIYTNCREILSMSEEDKQNIRVLMLMIEREKCLISYEKTQMREDSLAAEIITGESSDSSVIELRKKFKIIMGSLIGVLAYLESRNPEVIPTGPLNITDEQWRTYMHDLKKQIAEAPEDPAIRQRIEAGGPPTQEQTDKLREIVEYYLRGDASCKAFTLFGILGGVNRSPSRSRRIRSTSSEWKSKFLNQRILADPEPKPIIAKPSVEEENMQLLKERQARLKYWSKESAEDKTNLVVSLMDAIEKELNADNPSEIPIAKVPSFYVGLIFMANNFVANASADLRKEGYELLRDVILELRKLDNRDVSYEGYDIMTFEETFMNCLMHTSNNVTSEFIFTTVIQAGNAINLRYSGDGDGKKCGDPYFPIYGKFSYVGEEPGNQVIQNWRHILNGIVKLYFKIQYPIVHPKFGCDPETLLCADNFQTGSSEESDGIVKRSIEYPIRRFDNTVDDKNVVDRDNSGSLRRMNLDVDVELRNLDWSQKMFFDKMETLSSHIDRLHERYQKLNELNDDYVSREFSVELPLNDD